MKHALASHWLAAAGLLALLASPLVVADAAAADYVQSPGSTLAFATRYDGERFTGRFKDFDTTLAFDPARPEAARLDVVIALASVDTGNQDRDSTLAGSEFFDLGRIAQARYTAAGFRALGDGRYVADGSLSLRGVSHPVQLTFTWTPGASPVLVGSATVNRITFGVGGGDWADTALLPRDVAVSTRVVFAPRP